MLKVMLFFSNLCVQVLNCFVHSIAEYHWVQTCFITTTTTSSRNLQKSREITAVLQKVSILLGVELLSVIAFCAWLFCSCKRQIFISRLIKTCLSLMNLQNFLIYKNLVKSLQFYKVNILGVVSLSAIAFHAWFSQG